MKSMKLLIMIIALFFIAGCDQLNLTGMNLSGEDIIICNPPYIDYAEGCCLDVNENNICDSDEKIQSPGTTQSTNSADQSPGTTQSTNSAGIVEAELILHSTESDCWMLIENKVYDLSSYINLHPGGANNIIKYCGKDGTSAFIGISHSNFARSLLVDFFINDFIGDSTQLPTLLPFNNDDDDDDDEDEDDEDDEDGDND